MVAVNTGGDGGLGEVARHELQQSHLGRSVLHVHTVGVKAQIRLSADALAIVRVRQERLLGVVEMAVEDLFGEG